MPITLLLRYPSLRLSEHVPVFVFPTAFLFFFFPTSDFFFSLFNIGCLWGSLAVVVGRAMAALEGVLATRDLGYGGGWLSLAAVGLALPFQARRCYHHSCESDLFQVKQT